MRNKHSPKIDWYYKYDYGQYDLPNPEPLTQMGTINEKASIKGQKEKIAIEQQKKNAYERDFE